MRNLGRPSILGVAIAGALLPWAAPASAQITIAVSPALLELEGRAGDTGRIEITISNNGDEAFEVVTGLATFGAMTDERSALDWSAVTPGRLALEPGADVTATYAIDIPADAPSGGRFAAVTFTTVPPGAADATSVAGQIVVPVFLTVDGQGDLDRTTTLERMAVFLEPDGRLGVRAEVRNDGNVHVPFAGTVGFTAQDPALEASVDLVPGRVLPGVTRTYQGGSTLPLPLATTYDVTLRMGTPDADDRMIGEPVHDRTFTIDATPALELSAATIRDPAPALVAAAVRDGLHRRGLDVLPWTEASTALRDRLSFLHRNLGDPWPDVSDEALSDGIETWLGPELARIRGVRDLRRIDVLAALRRLLPWPEAGRLDELAPERVEVPSGSSVRVDYGGEQPVLAVRLQEVFGWAATPRLADGRVPLLLHLLTPARRPAAVTADLASFWANGYPQVRAELRGRYPKHAWPEDPMTAPPTRGVRRPPR